ncbi:MAG: general stress protein CsbD [Cyclobacteriaceae bacterium]|nr:general stress protein CsbD [Cyclobacteriaceae bacterium]
MQNLKDHKIVEEFRMNGDWKNQSRQLKAKYSQLSDEDLKYESGKENELLKRLGTRLNKSREEVISVLKKVQPIK